MNYLIKSQPVSIRVDPLTEDRIAFIQALATRTGNKKPSVTAIARLAIDRLVWNVDDLIEQSDQEQLQGLISSLDRAHQPQASSFSRTPSFETAPVKPFRDFQREAVMNRFRSSLDRMVDRFDD